MIRNRHASWPHGSGRGGLRVWAVLVCALSGGPVAAAPMPEDGYETVVVAPPPDLTEAPKGRASSTVDRNQLTARLPQSAPEALRYEPGVFVQQTAHGQGSAFIRGLTGQQTVMLFDGIRLNNSTYRQGPNQYFFTLDAQTLSSIEVVRGGASTRFGSDALGGALLAHPREPDFAPEQDKLLLRPSLMLRGATADREHGGRVESEFASGDTLAILVGAGARRVGALRSGGAVFSPADGSLPQVPRFDSDGRTQLGTGFDEVTFDARARLRLSARQNLTFATYNYRQYDVPRTDQCPPPFARYDECLRYEEQFRTLAYAAWQSQLGAAADELRVTLSWQRQHERRNGERPASFVSSIGRDDVDTFGVTLNATSAALTLAPSATARVVYGLDTYHDRVASRAWVRFTDIDHTEALSRGQYLDGATYTYGGAFAEARLSMWDDFALRVGSRLSWVRAQAAADPDSGSLAIDRQFVPLVGFGGLEWRATTDLTILANVDRSFRAPNLDDLTSRQQTGPGFQFENAALGPEYGTTFETGLRFRRAWLAADLWGFQTLLSDLVTKQPRDIEACPWATPQCRASWNRFQLVNARGTSVLRGIEALVLWEPTRVLSVRSSFSWTWGEGPNPAERPNDPTLAYDERVPLSRVPPPNGSLELQATLPFALKAGAAVRWARKQDRLAVADLSDARIPTGGTPGFWVMDLRCAYELDDVLHVAVVLENLFDAAYRYHGSSVNGRGRGVVAVLELKPF